MAGRKVSLLFLVFVFVLLLVNDTANYLTTRKELHATLESQMQELSAQIKISVVRSQQAYMYVDRLMASQLRSAAIAAKYALPPDYASVDNERLAELARELGISYLTLFTEGADEDVVSVRASDPRELNLSSKDWDNYYDAFRQLLKHRNVYGLTYGQSLPNYWAGDIAPSAAILDDEKNKYGYLYDGSTNYIINTIMNTKYIEELERYTGIETTLRDTVDQHEHLEEIAMFNPLTFSRPEEELVNVRDGVTIQAYDKRKILFGTYEMQSPDDAKHIEEAYRSGKAVHAFDKIDGKRVVRTFYPVATQSFPGPYVIGITSDYTAIQEKLNRQLLNLGIVTGLALAASLLMIGILYRFVNKERDDVAQAVQNNYNEEMQSLFVAVRGERHDFVNHLNTLKAMADTKRFEQLQRYVKELVDETIALNDIVSIGHPAVAAIIQSKTAVALRLRIAFTHQLEGMTSIAGVKGVKSVDIVKILANLIDNAFEEVMELEPEQRRVHVQGWIENERIVFSVSNALREELSNEQLQRMFLPTYTTKAGDGHSGLGLSIVREKARQYRGHVTVSTPEPRTIEFVVSVPIGA
ncbi:GHKL domain-containing protein [Paenibacillus sp. TRM 82003]|nr:GHKL domain-containing protein [Paenibacillus sp. TRM 82003]